MPTPLGMYEKHRIRIAGLALVTSVVGVPVSISAQTVDDVQTDRQTTNDYWTSDRLKSAKPSEPRARARLRDQSRSPGRQQKRPPAGGVAKPPENEPTEPTARLFASDENLTLREYVSETLAGPFTTSRVFPDGGAKNYPYSAAGALFYVNPTDTVNPTKRCSASVIESRIVVTAGHCALPRPNKDKKKQVWSDKLLYIPAYDGSASKPEERELFGRWPINLKSVFVSETWAYSDGKVPNGQDVAVLVVYDQVRGGQLKKIGQVTGTFGYKYRATNAESPQLK